LVFKAPRTIDIFTGERILVRRIINGDYLDAIWIKDQYINNTDIINIIPKENLSISTKSFLSLFNSKLYATYLKRSNVNLDRDAFPKINVNTMEEIPVPEISKSTEKELLRLADIMLSKNKELQEIQKEFTTLLVSEFSTHNPALKDGAKGKLEDWYLLDWSAFSNELKKKKIVLEEEQEVKWLKRFDRMKKEALAIKAVIDSTDKEIDILVYRLYDLTFDEVKIVDPAFSMNKKDYESYSLK
jgi:hypothetical protein